MEDVKTYDIAIIGAGPARSHRPGCTPPAPA